MAAQTSFFKNSGTSATLQTSFAQTVAQAQASAAAASASAAAALASQQAAAASAVDATTNGSAQVSLAVAQVALATTQAGLATSNGAAQVTLATAQVALATTQATNAASEAADALSSKNDAQGSEDEAEAWAQKTNGEAVTNQGYSSKAHAIGGTGVTSQTGSAIDWATKTNGVVDSGNEYSSKEYAVGTQQSVGSSKQWAIGGGASFTTATAVAGGVYSAKYYAETAQSAAATASGSLSTFQAVYLGSGSSDPTSGHTAGDLFFNSTLNKLRYFDSSSWVSIEASTGASVGEAIAFSIAL